MEDNAVENTGAAKATPKRKATAKKAPAKKKAAAKKASVKKAPAKRKTPAKKTAAKKTTAKRKTTARKATKASQDFKSRAVETGRNAFRAGLGVYGKAYDQMLEQFEALQKQVDDAQAQLNERRSKAEAIYVSLVKRGEVVEQDAMKAFDELELDAITDRKMLEEQMNKAKARFEALREKLSKSI